MTIGSSCLGRLGSLVSRTDETSGSSLVDESVPRTHDVWSRALQ